MPIFAIQACRSRCSAASIASSEQPTRFLQVSSASASEESAMTPKTLSHAERRDAYAADHPRHDARRRAGTVGLDGSAGAERCLRCAPARAATTGGAALGAFSAGCAVRAGSTARR